MRELGQAGSPNAYHEDHIVPLCAGGHPRDPKNLWPQPIRGQWNDNALKISWSGPYAERCVVEISRLQRHKRFFWRATCDANGRSFFPVPDRDRQCGPVKK